MKKVEIMSEALSPARAPCKPPLKKIKKACPQQSPRYHLHGDVKGRKNWWDSALPEPYITG
jgi:hypothetical protein